MGVVMTIRRDLIVLVGVNEKEITERALTV